jgi:hypothetical protein
VAEQILAALRANPGGLTLKQISRDVFSGHRTAAEIAAALGDLARLELGECTQRATAGRPAEVWIFRNGATKAAYAI